MDWRHAIERNGLTQIIALLFSLAFMAEHAVGLSPRMRRHLLDILRHGEASGLRLATRWGELADGADWPLFGDGYGPEDARRLAVSLRALGMALACQAQFDDRPSAALRDEGLRPNSCPQLLPAIGQWSAAPALIDTS